MSIPEFYIVDVFKSGSPPQVSELVGGTTINPIGAALTVNSAEAAVTTTIRDITNRVAEYRGQIYIGYITGSLVIDSYNRGSGLWSNSLTATSQAQTIGLYVTNTGTVQRLFTFTRSGTGGSILHYTDDGSSWTTTSSLGQNIPSTLEECPPIMFNNKLYIPYFNSGGAVYEVDPIAESYNRRLGRHNSQ